MYPFNVTFVTFIQILVYEEGREVYQPLISLQVSGNYEMCVILSGSVGELPRLKRLRAFGSLWNSSH